MRQLMSLAVAAALVVVNAEPTGAASGAAKRDIVRGRATHLGADPPYPRITVFINASSDPDGSNPRGVFVLESPEIGQQRRGEVTCLSVNGNMATIGIRIVKAEDPDVVGKGELFNFVDNEDGDQVAGYPITATPPTVCPPLFFSVPVVSGRYRISDATT